MFLHLIPYLTIAVKLQHLELTHHKSCQFQSHYNSTAVEMRHLELSPSQSCQPQFSIKMPENSKTNKQTATFSSFDFWWLQFWENLWVHSGLASPFLAQFLAFLSCFYPAEKFLCQQKRRGRTIAITAMRGLEAPQKGQNQPLT